MNNTTGNSITPALQLIVATLVLILAGCETGPTRTGPPAEVINKQITSTEEATRTHAAPQEEYILPESDTATALENAMLLIRQQQYGMARDLIEDLDPETMTPDLQTRKRTLDAELMLAADGVQQAAQLLRQPPEGTHPEILAEFYRLRAEVDLRQGRPASAVRNLVNQTRYRPSDPQQEQLLLWGAINLASPEALSRLAQDPDPVTSGWARLAQDLRTQRGNPTGTDQAIEAWRAVYPDHPASDEVLDEIRRASATPHRDKTRVALLLPLSSRYAQAARAIRDGITAINDDLPPSKQSVIRLYDYGDDKGKVSLYYRQAANEGADLIIGPLGRSATSQLLIATQITIPTILLSPAPDSLVLGNNDKLYTFALAPEQEARQAANRTWLDGNRNAVIMYPKDKLGGRMALAYRERFIQLGGHIIGEAWYENTNSGFSSQISHLMAVDQSEQRAAELSRRLGLKLKYEPRRRQDIDAIFLPANTDDARLIKPEFDYYFALDLPVYSTSRVFSGKPDPINDADLERVRFPDMPWMIASDIQIESLRTFLLPEWAREGSRYDRLYAMGMDLLPLTQKLEYLSLSPRLYQQGLTGNLHVADDGSIEHDMIWAVFRHGIPQLLDRNIGYQGRFDDDTLKQQQKTTGTPPAARSAR